MSAVALKPVADWSALSADERTALLERPLRDERSAVRSAVAAIVDRVRRDGDAAVLELTREFDRIDPGTLRVGPEQIDAAAAALDTAQREAIRAAHANIERFHAAQRRVSLEIETSPGVVCERIDRPIDAVGLYVPAGSAPLPSTALMLGVPAALAGCPTRVLVTPPGRDGRPDPAVLYVAGLCGIVQVFCAGGAQAVAAMAFGTESVPKVDKIFGPGNRYVTEAKRLVALAPGGAACDMPAGPSEVLVIADGDANPDFVAADLLSQAEHGPDSQVIAISPSTALLEAVGERIAAQITDLRRAAVAAASLRHARRIACRDLADAIAISNRYAPEHLVVQTRQPRALLADIRNAGSVFLGRWSPESVGDYCSGTNHVLPTDGHARAVSGLSLDAFVKTITVQTLTRRGLETIGPVAQTLANLEGLDAHARAIAVRLADATGDTAP